MILKIIFWTSIALLAHSYIFYPLILHFLSRKKQENKEQWGKDDNLPFVSIIMSVHNEEMVIVEKIRSIYYTLYPFNRFEVLVGSDASTDGTNRICKVYEGNYQGFRFYPFPKRQGKPAIINQLVKEAKGDILIMTDAKVFFTIDTIFELVRQFKNKEIQIVGGNILNEKVAKDGISRQEKAFMNREIVIKHNEGKIWGQTMGIYGAIYAIRKESFQPVPDGYSVDDFFITLNVLKKKGRAIMNMNAITKEDVPNHLAMEFRRKVRISAGNFQNLSYFASCLWPPYKSLAFVFMSHKVIRWLGPFLLMLILLSNILVFNHGMIYRISLYIQFFIYSLPLIDSILRKIRIDIVFLRFITHFLAMNSALVVGFIKNLSGKKTNIWQPTRR